MRKILQYLALVLFFCLNTAFAATGFLVEHITFKGLHRLSPSTAETYLPIKRGQYFTDAHSTRLLKSLYQTGFFDHIAFSQVGHTLVVEVEERPTIGKLTLKGNSVIPTDRLTTVMKSLDVAEGRVYNPPVLERIKQSLLNQYLLLGRYNAKVDIKTSSLSRGRVAVYITISEGDLAKIRSLAVVGNHAFSEKTLLKQTALSTVGLFTYFSETDRYSEEKLNLAVEKMRNYYLDHGYLRAEVKATTVSMSEDKKSVNIVFTVHEGAVYTVKKVELTGQLKAPADELRNLIAIQPGEIFSREKIIDAEKALTKRYGQEGYLFANVRLEPTLDDQSRQVTLLFDLSSGKRTYIRQITFADNSRTNDEVLRRELVQMEAAPASMKNLEESKHRLSLLPFIKDVEMAINPVPGKPNEVDAHFKVKEDNSAQATFKIGYSQIYGPILGVGLNQKNVFGSGNNLGINFQHSKYEQFYGLDYTNPYYTQDGISRTLSFSVSRVDPGSVASVNNGYTANEYNLGVLYGIPIGQEEGVYNRLLAGVSYQNFLINLRHARDGEDVSRQVRSFVNQYGRHYQEADIKVGLSRDSRDKAIFPTSGATQSLALDVFAPLAQSSILFYTLNYHAKWYVPISEQFILLNRADFGYGLGSHGAESYPFFKNFYAGGIDSVRGYSGYTLGPQDSNGKAFGGNILADASIGLIFPNYISDSVRTMAYVDAGNVYSSLDQRVFGGLSRNSGAIRYSFGVEVDWITPFGPIELSLAKALNPRASSPSHSGNGDDIEPFQFALGASF